MNSNFLMPDKWNIILTRHNLLVIANRVSELIIRKLTDIEVSTLTNFIYELPVNEISKPDINIIDIIIKWFIIAQQKNPAVNQNYENYEWKVIKLYRWWKSI